MGAGASIPDKLSVDDCKKLAGVHWNADIERTFNSKQDADGTISREAFQSYLLSHHDLELDIQKGTAKKVKRRNNVHTEHYDIDPNFKPKNIPKSIEISQQLEAGFKDHFLFKGLSRKDTRALVAALEEERFNPGDNITTQGEHGDTFHVLIEGEVSIIVDGKEVEKKKAPYAFGELSLIYDVVRAATIKSTTSCIAYATNRMTFRKTLASMQSSKQVHRCEFLRKMPYFQNFSNHLVNQIAEAMSELRVSRGEHIVKQGDVGKTFYIIWAGTVKVSQKGDDGVSAELKELKAGDYFGERALIKGEPRVATCTAASDTVICLALAKESFDAMLGPLEELMKKQSARQDKENAEAVSNAPPAAPKLKPVISSLSDVRVVRTIGTGTFGRVKFVQRKSDGLVMAMKCLLKSQIHAAHQEKNILYERNCMAEMNHPFVLKLIGTFQDQNQLYMLLEIVMGGELWSLLYSKSALQRTQIGGIKENDARFYIACTLAGFVHIHERGYTYRDLKPENLLVDKDGYIRICDFGFAKRLREGEKTATLCGTPEYLAPELVLSRGHNRGVDYWALGVLIYELITGNTPFFDNNQSRIFVKIINAAKVLSFPSGLRPSAQDLIRKLLDPNPALRLGMLRGKWEDIKQHIWFKGIDFPALEKKEYTSPWVPKVKTDLDDSNFDNFEGDGHIPKYKGDQSIFKDF